MSYQFYVNEESGEKLFKIAIVKLSRREVIKIISKESKKGRIHFIIRLCQVDPDTEDILSQETKYKSMEKGVTKRQFDSLMDALIEKLPDKANITIHDMSHYSSLMDQFSTGVMDGLFNLTTTPHSKEWN